MNIQSLTMFPVAAVQALARMFGATSQVRSGFSLTAVGAGSLGITVASGTAWVNGVYLNYAGAGSPVIPGAASATQGRYDLIVVASGAVVPSIVAGTAAEAPVPPALAAGALFLGYVFIGPTATDYTDATKAFIADYTVPIVNFAGTVAAPAMPFSGDLDTGWISPGADRIQTVTGGVARSETTSAGHFVPVSTSITDLGTTALRWRDVNAVSLNGGVTMVGCRVFHSVNQTIGSTSTVTLTFDSERFDTASMHSSVTNPTRITLTASGYYAIGGQALKDAATANDWLAYLQLNGSTIIALQRWVNSGAAQAANLATFYQTTVTTDYVEMLLQNLAASATSVTAAVNYSPEFWAYRVGV